MNDSKLVVSDELKNFIEKHINEIETEDKKVWQDLYINFEDDFDGDELPGLFGKLMLDVGVDPTRIMKYVPRRFVQYQKDVTNYDIPEGTEYVGFAAFEDSGLEHVTIPNSVTEFDYVCFAGTKIKSIDIPPTVTRIENAVFHSCKLLEKIDISNIKVLGEGVFALCTNLYNVILPTLCPEIYANCFDGCDKLIQLVYYGTRSEFETVKEGTPEYTLKVVCSDGVYTWEKEKWN